MGDLGRSWVVLGDLGWHWVILSDLVWSCVILGDLGGSWICGWSWVIMSDLRWSGVILGDLWISLLILGDLWWSWVIFSIFGWYWVILGILGLPQDFVKTISRFPSFTLKVQHWLPRHCWCIYRIEFVQEKFKLEFDLLLSLSYSWWPSPFFLMLHSQIRAPWNSNND